MKRIVLALAPGIVALSLSGPASRHAAAAPIGAFQQLRQATDRIALILPVRCWQWERSNEGYCMADCKEALYYKNNPTGFWLFGPDMARADCNNIGGWGNDPATNVKTCKELANDPRRPTSITSCTYQVVRDQTKAYNQYSCTITICGPVALPPLGRQRDLKVKLPRKPVDGESSVPKPPSGGALSPNILETGPSLPRQGPAALGTPPAGGGRTTPATGGAEPGIR